MSNHLKNIPSGTVLSLRDLVSVSQGQVISKTLTKNELVRITLFAFCKGEGLSTHSADGDALIQVIQGKARITLDGTEFTVNEGESIVLPAEIPHSAYALEDFKMLLTVVFPPENHPNS